MRLFELVRLATPLWCISNALLALSLKLHINKENQSKLLVNDMK